MAKRKIAQIAFLVEGMLEAADKVGTSNAFPRASATGVVEWSCLSDSELKCIGRYQGRVVLVALAAELALKSAWEQEDPERNAAPNHHNLMDLFHSLSPGLQGKILVEYKKSVSHPDPGWQDPGSVFEKCKDSYKTWEYLGEEGPKPEWVMEAKWLKEATLSVVRALSKDQGGNHIK